jgi:hypothetical protein
MPSELLYRIIDEPTESRVAGYAVRPFWPWLSLALAGTWLGAPWFIFNAVALGSPTKKREIALAAALPLVQLVVFVASVLAAGQLGFQKDRLTEVVGFVMLPYSFVKLVCGYLLFTWQSRVMELHEHFGKPTRNGVFVLVVGTFLSSRLIASLPVLVTVALR